MPIKKAMKWASVIAMSLLLIGGLTAGGVYWYRPKIEKDLLSRTTASLQKKDVSLENAVFSGRDGTLVIEKLDTVSAAEVKQTAESVFGVRVAKVEEIRKEEPSIIAERIGSHLKLSGKLPQKEWVERFVSRAAEVFGADNVQHAFEETPLVRRAGYLSGLVNFVQLLEQIGPEAKFSVQEKLVVLAGLVPDMETKNALEKLARDRVPQGLEFKSELAVPERTTTATRGPDLDELLDAVRLNFEYDSTRFTAETRGNLELLKQTLSEYEIGRIRISGYTDSKGSETYNLRLSKRRAATVLKKLSRFGFPLNRFEIEGRGEADSVADNATEEGRQLNRRVTFKIAGEK
jgi:outer membrane protein OmpA-like peptidoglycan-associated protein